MANSKRFFHTILFILTCLVLLTSCKKQNVFDFMPNNSEFEGIYYKDANNEIETDLNFELENEEIFSTNIILANMTNSNMNYKMIVFIDYIQIEYVAEGEKRLYYDFRLKSKKEKELPVIVGKLDSGSHDIMFLFIKDPENKNDDFDYRLNTKFSGMIYSIINITVNNTNEIEYLPVNCYKQEIEYEEADINIVSITDDNLVESTTTIYPNKKYRYNVIVSNGGNNNNFALIALLDFAQIDIAENKKVQYLYLPKNYTYKLENFIAYKDTSDNDNLVYLLIENPYTEIEYYRKAYFSTRLNIWYKE